jgi:hypothetical protein
VHEPQDIYAEAAGGMLGGQRRVATGGNAEGCGLQGAAGADCKLVELCAGELYGFAVVRWLHA